MKIHRLNKLSGGSCMTKHITKSGKVCKHMNARMSGSGLKDVFDAPASGRATETLRNLHIAKPRLPKKYITFE
jgi:hypothetical protein